MTGAYVPYPYDADNLPVSAEDMQAAIDAVTADIDGGAPDSTFTDTIDGGTP